jgi:hypothetical protein
MDQGVIQNLKLHYCKLVIQIFFRAVDNKTDLTISVLDALRMFSQAWGSVTSKTISNCFHHTKFVNPTVATESEDEEDPEDDIPLSRIFNFGFAPGTTVEDYTTIDSDIPTSASITDDDIVQETISARDIEIDDTSDQEDDTTSAPVKRPMEEVLAACNIIREQLECSEKSETALMQFNVVTRFLMKQLIYKLCTVQSDISSFCPYSEIHSNKD